MTIRSSLCLLAVSAVTAWAAAPGVFLLQNAHVVRVTAPPLNQGDVLIRDGLIEAVGEHLTAPADAWIVDCSGLTIYPGFIDALSTWGLPGAAPAAPAGRTGSTPAQAPAATTIPAPPPSKGPEDRPMNASFYRAADHLSTAETVIPVVRDAGFTTAVVFPTNNIFAGQGAVIDFTTTPDAKPGAMVVQSPAGQYLSMKTDRWNSFPDSLMGTIAYIRQIYLDAAHYKQARDIYAAHPEGLQRPQYDQWLEGVLESPRALLPASRAVEIDRMIRFAQGLAKDAVEIHPVLYGGQEAWRWTAQLKQSSVPILVSLKWPERLKDADPADADSLRVLEYRDKAPTSPAALTKAGVLWAFYSDGVSNAKDFKKALKRALDAGLSKDDAIRAMTLSPAQIYGVSDRLGSLDKGKIANLVVTDGDWFDEKTKVRFVLVDGQKYEPLPEEPKKEDTKKASE